jgi:phospholipid-translocating ATPase
MDMRLVLRDQKKIQIVNANGDVESYKILANFPFTSESKRMGIILKHEESSRIVFYLKGADTIMKNKVPEV